MSTLGTIKNTNNNGQYGTSETQWTEGLSLTAGTYLLIANAYSSGVIVDLQIRNASTLATVGRAYAGDSQSAGSQCVVCIPITISSTTSFTVRGKLAANNTVSATLYAVRLK